jgi:hypothetical protein
MLVVGYGFLFNMPGAGSATVGAAGTGGSIWRATAALGLSVWVSALPAAADEGGPTPAAAAAIYEQYADATGHAPMLREDAMIFWQSRNRYKSTDIALSVADRYRELGLPVGVLVIDYENELMDGDFAPNPACYPSLKTLSAAVRERLNATTVFSFWPEAKNGSTNFELLRNLSCIINPDLGGFAVDHGGGVPRADLEPVSQATVLRSRCFGLLAGRDGRGRHWHRKWRSRLRYIVGTGCRLLQPLVPISAVDTPFDTGCSPLRHSGNPGVQGVSYRVCVLGKR